MDSIDVEYLRLQYHTTSKASGTYDAPHYTASDITVHLRTRLTWFVTCAFALDTIHGCALLQTRNNHGFPFDGKEGKSIEGESVIIPGL